MLTVVSYAIMIIGAVLVLIGAIASHRKGESEISQSLMEVPTFKIGVIALIIGVIFRIVLLFI